jgi:hypothetical protein
MLQVKQYHVLYPKDFIEEALKDAPGGVAIFWKAQHPTKFHSLQLGIATHEKLFFISSKQEILVPLSKVFHTR